MAKENRCDLVPMMAASAVLETPGGAPPPPPQRPPTGYGGPPGPGYGGPAAGHGGPPAPQGRRSSGKAVASLVLGIVGICTAWIIFVNFIALITGVLAIILGVLGKKEADESQGQLGGSGMAVAGIVLGIVSLVVAILTYIWLGAVFDEFAREFEGAAATLFLL